MKHKYFFFLMTVLMSMAASVASAHDFEVDGIYYRNTTSYYPLSYTVAVTYRGNGRATYDNEYTGSVTIPESVTYNNITYSVTRIDGYAFWDCSGLTSVSIPSSVTDIGYQAFCGCSGLTSVSIGNSVTSIDNSMTTIGTSAFSGCSALTSVTIGNSVTAISDHAFSACSALTSVTIGNSVTRIHEAAFSGTAWYNNQPDGLVYAGKVAYKYKGTMPEGTSIVLEEGTLGIADYAFSSCRGLTSITIPNSVISIGRFAFSGCKGLTSVTIPNSVTLILGSAFRYCSSLETIAVNSGNTVYDSREGCNAIIEMVSNTLIAGCKNTIIPNSVTSIGNNAFYGCSGLTSISIPNSVTNIYEYAFSGCRGLTFVAIGNSVTSIGECAFESCNGLIDMYCYATDVPKAYSSSFPSPVSRTLHVPASSLEAYMTTDPWSKFGTIVALTDEEVGIKTIQNSPMSEAEEPITRFKNQNVHDLSGRQQRKMQRGMNLLRMSDGTTRKVLVK